MDVEFLEALLHDLKGPVSRVRILCELLDRRTKGLDAETQGLIQHISASAIAAENVLQAVRRYAETIGKRFSPRRFDLTVALNNAVARAQEKLRSSGANVVHGALPEITGDPSQMATLFEELINNAVRFRSEEPPVINVTATREPESWLITVSDNGMGLNGSDMNRIFRPFVKTAKQATPGIGLAICRHIARLHGGEITAVPGAQGTEMRLSLPE